MKILKSFRNKNNKLTKKSRRLINKNRLMFKNGGGKKEDLIKQIVDITDQIYRIERACSEGSSWCNAPGPNTELDALYIKKTTLIDEYKSEFPIQDLDDALALRRIQRREEEERPQREQRAREEKERTLKHIQWQKEQDAQEKVRLQREYDSSINSYTERIQTVAKEESSSQNERDNLEMWYDNSAKLCRNQESLERLTRLYNDKKKILQTHFRVAPVATAPFSRMHNIPAKMTMEEAREKLKKK